MGRPDGRSQIADPFVRIPGILSSLQDKGPKTQRIALIAAVQDLLFVQAVALGIFIGPADPAVIAVVFAPAGDLDQSPQINVLSENRLSDLPGRGIKSLAFLPCQRAQKGLQVFIREGPPVCQLFYPVHDSSVSAHGHLSLRFRSGAPAPAAISYAFSSLALSNISVR